MSLRAPFAACLRAGLTVVALDASPAEASTLSFDAGVYAYTGMSPTSTATIVGVSALFLSPGNHVFSETATITVVGHADLRCGASGTHVTCQAVGVAKIVPDTLGGTDKLSVSSSRGARPCPWSRTVATGNHTLTGFNRDTIDGGDTLDGGGGDDDDGHGGACQLLRGML
jgi:hypothetical protein